jgi:hypothetical protein
LIARQQQQVQGGSGMRHIQQQQQQQQQRVFARGSGDATKGVTGMAFKSLTTRGR